MKLVFLMLGLLYFCSLPAQSVSGKISDENQRPIESVSVLLLRQEDSSLVMSSLTDRRGFFNFMNVAGGQYIIEISATSYLSKFLRLEKFTESIELETIYLERRTVLMKEVLVQTKKPFLEQIADKLIVNVANSAIAAGSTALEVLQKVPGLLVMNNQITIVGKGTPSIMIDGKLSPYSNIAQLLRDISSDNIEKIEVISNPGAKFDATGNSVINIVLKKNSDLGTNIRAYLITGQGLYDGNHARPDKNFYRFNPGFNVTHLKGKLNLHGGYGLFYRNQFSYSEYDRINQDRLLQINNNALSVRTHNFRVGADLYPNKKNTLGFFVRSFISDGRNDADNATSQMDVNTGQTVNAFQTFNNAKSTGNSIVTNLYWKSQLDTLGTDLSVDLDYSFFNFDNHSKIITILPGSSYNNIQLIKNNLDFFAVKADYTHPLTQHLKFETGFKSSFAFTNNNIAFVQQEKLNTDRSVDFEFRENINALYSSLTYHFGDWEVVSGLRTEQTWTKGFSLSKKLLTRNYWQFFPSILLEKRMTRKLSGILQYSRRVNRPTYQQQTPFIEYVDSLTYTKGNPLIKPETSDEYKFSLTLKNTPLFSISYNKRQNVIVSSVPKQDGDLIYTIPENFATYENIAFEINKQIDLKSKFSGNLGTQIIYNHYTSIYGSGQGFNKDKWNWMVYWQGSYKPAESWNFELSGYYITQFLSELTVINNMNAVNIAIQKFFWGKKANITLNINDILYGEKINGSVQYQDVNMHFTQIQESRNLRLTFRYSFGNQKLKTPANRITASGTEENRVKQPNN